MVHKKNKNIRFDICCMNNLFLLVNSPQKKHNMESLSITICSFHFYSISKSWFNLSNGKWWYKIRMFFAQFFFLMNQAADINKSAKCLSFRFLVVENFMCKNCDQRKNLHDICVDLVGAFANAKSLRCWVINLFLLNHKLYKIYFIKNSYIWAWCMGISHGAKKHSFFFYTIQNLLNRIQRLRIPISIYF